MIHYHGAPLTPEGAAAQVYAGRHAMVSYANPEQMPLVAKVCQSFALDCGAYPLWRRGEAVGSWEPYYAWVEQWMRHPGFDWFVIPDVIEGSELENDELIDQCVIPQWGVPVWHLHESIERLTRLVEQFPRIALGSSGKFAQLKTDRWWRRMAEVMRTVCDVKGQPMTKLHGLRMLDPKVFTEFPFASADSTNAARNVGYDVRWGGPYAPIGKAARGVVIASNIESFQSSHSWLARPEQNEFSLMLPDCELL